MSAPTEPTAPTAPLHIQHIESHQYPDVDGHLRELPLRTDNRSMSLVFFPAGTVEPYHHHTCSDQMYILSGEVKVDTQGTVYHLKKGDFFYIPGGQSHQVTYVTDVSFLYINDGVFDGPIWDSDAKDTIYPAKKD